MDNLSSRIDAIQYGPAFVGSNLLIHSVVADDQINRNSEQFTKT